MRHEYEYEAVMSIITCDACHEKPGLMVEWWMNTALDVAKHEGWKIGPEVDICPRCVVAEKPVLRAVH
jgi:hypothetical protein